jgi:hypothetical protein
VFALRRDVTGFSRGDAPAPTGLRVPPYDRRSGGATGVFRTVVLTPALATFETLRRQP